MRPPPGGVLLLHFAKPNRNAFVALLGALEAAGGADALTVECLPDPDAMAGRCRAPGRSPAVAAFSFFTAQAPAMEALLARCRRAAGGGVLFLAGGPHPTGAPEDTLRMGFDYVLAGEGERSFPAFMEAVMEGRDPGETPGAARLGPGGRLHIRPMPPPVDLDLFPPASPRFRRFGPLEISRGCPFACAYCQTPRLAGRRMRHRKAEGLVPTAGAMRRRGMRDFRFITPNAFAYGSRDGRTPDPEAMEGLLRALREAAGPEARLHFGSFPSEVRPESVTPEALSLVRRYADTRELVIGAQSGSPRMLERCRRRHGPDEVVLAVERTVRAGLGACVDFIFGMPGEREGDQRATARLMEACVRLGARIHAHAFTPLPGTPWAQEAPVPMGGALLATVHALLGRGRLFGEWRARRPEERPRRRPPPI